MSHLGDLDCVEGGAFAEVVADHEHRQAMLDGRVAADAAYIGRIAAGCAERSRHIDELDAGRCSQQLSGALRRDRPLKAQVQRERMASEHRDANAGARDGQVWNSEDLAALVAELLLFIGLAQAVVDKVACLSQHIVRYRAGELVGRRVADSGAVEGERCSIG